VTVSDADSAAPGEKGAVPLSRPGVVLLMAAAFVAAACAIVYELLIGSTSSFFLGDSVEEFSLTIGFFLFAMGLGSWASRAVRRRLLERFVALELGLGLVGGGSVLVLYAAFAHTGHYRYSMLLLTVAIGALIGLELPLLTRLLRACGSLRAVLADVLSLDYLGSLAAALLFPYVLLPFLGSLHTAAAAGLLNAGVGVAVLAYFWSHLAPPSRRWLAAQAGLVLGALVVILGLSEPYRRVWEEAFYGDRVVHVEQSPYQRIVLTQWRRDLRLFLDGHLQFSAVDEYRYHEALVHPALSLAPSRERVLLVEGGDGLSAREILKYADVRHLDLVDLDAAVTDLAARHERLVQLNAGALLDARVHIHNEDGFVFLQRPHQAYGAIVVDLPDPRREALTKLYSVEGYRLFRRHLTPAGVLATQASSPYYARRAYWSVVATLEAAGFHTHPYHTLVPSFGEWGFVLASGQRLDPQEVVVTVPTRFLDSASFAAMGLFPADMSRVADAVINRMDRPVLARVYREAWSAW